MKQFAIVFAIFLASAVTVNGAALPEDDCFCTRIFSPVCGSDGVTYSNMCEFECEAARTNGILTVTKGACLEKDMGCQCPMVFSPVCGSNGVTYKNMCEFQCVAARINERLTVTKGACLSKPIARQACLCTKIYKPVCGSDGETYANMCEFDCVAAQATDVVLTARNGACLPKPMARQDCNCDRIFSPVCGSDGVTYANECEFECVAAQTADVVLTSEDGPCMAKPKPRQACLCPKIYKPVCGSDGETYANMCEFDCVAAQATDVVLTARNGACLPKPMTRQDCNCDRIFSPVCGSDGITYANECEFECVAAQTTDVVLTSEDGPCMAKPKPRQACLCPKIYKPVCGSNDETYANMCEFECVAEQTTDVVLTAKNGACLPKPMARQDCVCDRIFSPVCGSDGVTYANECEFECVAAQTTDVVLTSEDGPCMAKPKPRQACLCPKIYKPVCGSNDETYANMCEFECVAEQTTDVVLTAKNGACLPKPMARQDCVCDRTFSPVCGSDGVTYSNECVFECVAAQTTDVVLTSEDGPCMLKPKARQACLCTKIYKPVCGSDGETYANMCEFECAAEQTTDVVLTAKNGVC